MNYHLIPDWSESVSETYEFRTSIFVTRSGREQRFAERIRPRRTVTFSAVIWNRQLSEFQAFLHDRGDATVTIPDAARYAAILSHPAAVSADELRLASSPPWLAVDQHLALSNFEYSEFVTSDALSNFGAFGEDFDPDAFDVDRQTLVEIASPLTRAWPAGSVLRPTITGRLAKQVTLAYLNDKASRAEISLKMIPPSELPDLGAPNPEEFNSRPVLTVAPNWTQPPSVVNQTPYEEVDYGRGVTKTYLPVEFYTRITQFAYSGRSREDVGKVLDLFFTLRGRQGEFYSPSWITDMVPSGNIVADDPELTVFGSTVYDRYAESTVNKAIAIRLVSGEWIFREIESIAEVIDPGPASFDDSFDDSVGGEYSGTFSRITVTEDFPDNIHRKNIAMICWLNVCRFASDSLLVRWFTDDVAEVLAQIMTLESLTPET